MTPDPGPRTPDPRPTLLPGADHFHVEEIPAYAPSGSGEHLYVQIEKRGLNTDQVAELLARACGRSPRDVGYAGRKDRHAVTVQWFSVLGAQEESLANLHAPRDGALRVTTVARHGNKLRLGHLRGNRFRLGLAGVEATALATAAERLHADGLSNRFGPQRFGLRQASLRLGLAWGAGTLERACEIAVDPDDQWRWGAPLPPGFRSGIEGQVVGALKRGAAAGAALAAPGPKFRQLAASAVQAAVFNAVHDARAAAGLLRRVRPGDLALAPSGAPFLVEDAAEVSARCITLDAFATAPLPGTWRLAPAAAVVAEERAWSAATGVDWAWLQAGGALESPGERRALLIRMLDAPRVSVADGITWLELALPSGAYATEALAQLGVAVPADRRG